MKKNNWTIKIVISFMVSVIFVLFVMAGSFILMLFESGEDGMRKCFFDTLFFQSNTKADGSVQMIFGLTGNYLPIFISIIVVFVFCLIFNVIYTKLVVYKNTLKKE